MSKFNPNFYMDAADDAEMIQKAVDKAAKTGEKVIVPRHNERTGKDIWIIPRAIKVYTGTTICLDNCHLRQADDSFDNIFKNSYARTEEGKLLENRQYDIHIYGVGNALIDGGNHNGLIERNANRDGRPRVIVNSPMHFVNCERIRIEDLRFIHCRYWGICFHFCSSGRVSNIYFMNFSNCPNQDGIDLRTGCNNFVIENISGFTQDDTVALTNGEATYDVVGMDNSIHNVIIRNITTGTRCAQVRLLNHFGRKVYNITIENLMTYVEYDPSDEVASKNPLRIPCSENYFIDSKTTSAQPENEYWRKFSDDTRPSTSVRIGENYYYNLAKPETKAQLGDTYNVIVRNVQSRARFPIFIGRTLADSVIENVQAFGDSAVAVFIDGGEYDNLKFNNVGYSRKFAEHFEEYQASQVHTERDFDLHTIMHFSDDAFARNIKISGITTSSASPAVFEGNADVEVEAHDIYLRDKSTPLVKGNIKVNLI